MGVNQKAKGKEKGTARWKRETEGREEGGEYSSSQLSLFICRTIRTTKRICVQ